MIFFQFFSFFQGNSRRNLYVTSQFIFETDVEASQLDLGDKLVMHTDVPPKKNGENTLNQQHKVMQGGSKDDDLHP